MKANDTKASETQADIVAEMRHGFDQSWHDIDREWVHSLPDRLDAAAKRDCEYPKAQSLDADKLTGKTISGLVTDLRQIAKYHYARGNIVQGQFARVMADRIEAAAKREAEGRREVMNIEELETIADAMAEEGGDQIDALYDTVTLQNDTYNGFICRLREVVRLAKNEQEKSAPVGNAAEMHKALENIVKVGYPHNFQHEAPHISGYCYEITDAITKCFEALAATPRNCDAFSKAEVLKVLEDRSFSKEDTIEWLYSTAEERKGGNNGGK